MITASIMKELKILLIPRTDSVNSRGTSRSKSLHDANAGIHTVAGELAGCGYVYSDGRD